MLCRILSALRAQFTIQIRAHPKAERFNLSRSLNSYLKFVFNFYSTIHGFELEVKKLSLLIAMLLAFSASSVAQSTVPVPADPQAALFLLHLGRGREMAPAHEFGSAAYAFAQETRPDSGAARAEGDGGADRGGNGGSAGPRPRTAARA